MDLWLIIPLTLILLGAIIAIIVIGVVKPKPNEEYSSTYSITDNHLSCLKENYQIGQPTGILKYLPNQSSCETQYNLLVQPDVAFKPTRKDTGCTYVELRYPG